MISSTQQTGALNDIAMPAAVSAPPHPLSHDIRLKLGIFASSQ